MAGTWSSVTIGGGGLGQVYGETTNQESIETLRAAVVAGINVVDVAPMYGNGEAERVVGAAFNGSLPSGCRVVTKCLLGNPALRDVETTVRGSLTKSLELLQLPGVDVLLLHSNIVPDGWVLPDDFGPGLVDWFTPWTTYTNGWIPVVESLMKEGLIRNWGITGILLPQTVIKALRNVPKPQVIQAVTNCLDSIGNMRWFIGDAAPREIIRVAVEQGCFVLGVRALGAGAFCDKIDRPLSVDDPTYLDWCRSLPLRTLATNLGLSTATLALRYALAIPGVGSVVLGVKNRAELGEVLVAMTQGALSPELVARVDGVLARARHYP